MKQFTFLLLFVSIVSENIRNCAKSLESMRKCAKSSESTKMHMEAGASTPKLIFKKKYIANLIYSYSTRKI